MPAASACDALSRRSSAIVTFGLLPRAARRAGLLDVRAANRRSRLVDRRGGAPQRTLARLRVLRGAFEAVGVLHRGSVAQGVEPGALALEREFGASSWAISARASVGLAPSSSRACASLRARLALSNSVWAWRSARACRRLCVPA